jgi:hypothetical protein
MSVATEVDFEEHSDEWKTFIVIYCSLPLYFMLRAGFEMDLTPMNIAYEAS